MPINWPPASAPSWPPPEISPTWFSAADLAAFLRNMREKLLTVSSPTPQEGRDYFDGVLCDHGHAVKGWIFVSPSEVRYPFAVCLDPIHRDVLVLWPPYYCGAGSANEVVATG